MCRVVVLNFFYIFIFLLSILNQTWMKNQAFSKFGETMIMNTHSANIKTIFEKKSLQNHWAYFNQTHW